jgi:hypothetical protein
MTKSADTLLAEYFDYHQKAMLRMQFIEELIRMYLSRHFEIIRRKTRGIVIFKYNYSDVQKKALGALVEDLNKTNGNSILVKSIKTLVKDRNYCAHGAFLLTYEEQKNVEYLKNELDKMKDIANRAEECLLNLTNEANLLDKILMDA